jgi:hypothetical protein
MRVCVSCLHDMNYMPFLMHFHSNNEDIYLKTNMIFELCKIVRSSGNNGIFVTQTSWPTPHNYLAANNDMMRLGILPQGGPLTINLAMPCDTSKIISLFVETGLMGDDQNNGKGVKHCMYNDISDSRVIVAIDTKDIGAKIIVGAAVFELSLCNSKQYCVTVKLLAAKQGCHAGTKLMNALKALTCCSSAKSGYVVAHALKSADWFYKTQLPQIRTPMVMAMFMSQHCLNPIQHPINSGYVLRGDAVFAPPI